MINNTIYKNTCFIFLFLFLVSLIFAENHADHDIDILIKNGKVFEGSIKPAFKADVAIKNGKIIELAKTINKKAKRVINARGLYVTPGFIDLHTHADWGMFYPEHRPALNYLKQGVTTVVVGQCGSSGWPDFDKMPDQARRWSKSGVGPNVALLVGHGSVRGQIMGNDNREPTPEELAQMKALVKEAMEQGASGISTGLIYIPGRYAKTDELIEVVKVIAPYGGIYHSHIRNENNRHIEAIKEAIEIGEKAGVPVHISHFKVTGRANWGNLKEASLIIEKARKKGLTITADQYPYRFTNTFPYRPLIPTKTWLGGKEEEVLTYEDVYKVFDYLRDAQLINLYKKVSANPVIAEGVEKYLHQLPRKELVRLTARSVVDLGKVRGPENKKARAIFFQRLQDPKEADKIRLEVKDYIKKNIKPEDIMIATCVDKSLEGKSLKAAARIKGKSEEDTAIELFLQGATAIPFRMCEEDIEFAMKKDYVATGSDGTVLDFGIDLTHIRSYSTFLHKIKKYVFKRKAISLAHALRSQTSLPAQIMNWKNRGWIKKGYMADIAVLDLKNLKTMTSISNPHRYSSGVKFLLVNGKLVLDKGQWTGKLPGTILKLKSGGSKH
jgi:N-acyl-D-aspartate/D-glutamate deacylase